MSTELAQWSPQVGTAESEWAAAAPWGGAPELDLSGVRRIVVVAPHPDDEVLGAGGLLQVPLPRIVIAVTDGEASHPGSLVLPPSRLAALRREERSEALRRLTSGPVPVHRLRHSDGAVDPVELHSQLGALLQPGDACAVTARFDGHPDHDACGRAAVAAAGALGVPVWEYPIWTWHRTGPGDPQLPWHRARVLTLSQDRAARKAHALRAFVTQTAAAGPDEPSVILPPQVLAHFARPCEVFFLAPAYPQAP